MIPPDRLFPLLWTSAIHAANLMAAFLPEDTGVRQVARGTYFLPNHMAKIRMPITLRMRIPPNASLKSASGRSSIDSSFIVGRRLVAQNSIPRMNVMRRGDKKDHNTRQVLQKDTGSLTWRRGVTEVTSLPQLVRKSTSTGAQRGQFGVQDVLSQ